MLEAAKVYSQDDPKLDVNTDEFLEALEQAYFFSTVITYAQGMFMLENASKEYSYDLHLGEIAKIWRGGCIIRSEFLNDIYNAYNGNSRIYRTCY